MDPNKAYTFASHIEAYLRKEGIQVITIDDLIQIVGEKLKDENRKIAEKYGMWKRLRQCRDPLIILIGGASGVGTSSIAFEVANRLGIRNMISTDMIREVMRKIVSEELLPTIYESSYTAYRSLRIPPPPELDEVLIGFRDHVDTVSVGVDAVIERALKEGISIVIENERALIRFGFVHKPFFLFHGHGYAVVIGREPAECQIERCGYHISRESVISLFGVEQHHNLAGGVTIIQLKPYVFVELHIFQHKF